MLPTHLNKRSRRCRAAYLLLEMILALSIFVVALAPVGRTLNTALEVFLAIDRESKRQTALINHTQILLASPVQVGKTITQDPDSPLRITTEIEPYEPERDPLQPPITNVFRVLILVEDDEGKLESEILLRRLE